MLIHCAYEKTALKNTYSIQIKYENVVSNSQKDYSVQFFFGFVFGSTLNHLAFFTKNYEKSLIFEIKTSFPCGLLFTEAAEAVQYWVHNLHFFFYLAQFLTDFQNFFFL